MDAYGGAIWLTNHIQLFPHLGQIFPYQELKFTLLSFPLCCYSNYLLECHTVVIRFNPSIQAPSYEAPSSVPGDTKKLRDPVLTELHF